MTRNPTGEGPVRGLPIHPSLVRPELTLGVERQVAGVEATLCFALLFGARLSFATVTLVAIVVLVIHPIMVWLTARDLAVTQIYARSRRYADFYAPQGAPGSAVRSPRASIPRVR